MITLIKMSEPGWEQTFTTERDARPILFDRICSQCRTEDSITEHSCVEAMLATACGCEYWVDDGDNDVK